MNKKQVLGLVLLATFVATLFLLEPTLTMQFLITLAIIGGITIWLATAFWLLGQGRNHD